MRYYVDAATLQRHTDSCQQQQQQQRALIYAHIIISDIISMLLIMMIMWIINIDGNDDYNYVIAAYMRCDATRRLHLPHCFCAVQIAILLCTQGWKLNKLLCALMLATLCVCVNMAHRFACGDYGSCVPRKFLIY